MKPEIRKLEKDYKALLKLGAEILLDLHYEHLSSEKKIEKNDPKWKSVKGCFMRKYHDWYSQASAFLRQILPERYDEFVDLYRPDPARQRVDITTYKIQDWIKGHKANQNEHGKKVFEDLQATIMNFQTQLNILKSTATYFKSSLYDIRKILQADLHQSELDSARELLRNGHEGAAAIVAGLALEKHLEGVCVHRGLEVQKNGGIEALSDFLKEHELIDATNWRLINKLGDLRNQCGSEGQGEPDAREIGDLIEGAEKIIRTVG
ncbi:MAG: HEPN domain-containing protein [Alphaproteobacteria bacterium]|nr:HEPN domain-containing protein [Alphaproteobacteria bacterium]